jgi:hypothetical protein
MTPFYSQGNWPIGKSLKVNHGNLPAAQRLLIAYLKTYPSRFCRPSKAAATDDTAAPDDDVAATSGFTAAVFASEVAVGSKGNEMAGV